MNDSEIGLIEESNYADDVMTSTLYVVSVGAKDVGSYRCDQIGMDIMDIDQDTTEHGVYVFVTGSSLTSADTKQIYLLDSSSSTIILPCTPTHTAVTVKVTANGEDVTQLFKFDPMVGFTAISPLAVSSFTCYFSYQNRTESVHLKQIYTGPRPMTSPVILPVTLHINEDQVEALDAIEIFCKVVTDENYGVDIYWTIPGMKTQELHKDDFTVLYTDKYSIEQLVMEGVVVSTLIVEEVGEEDQGIYRCHADQLNGQSGEADIFLNVEDKLSDLVTVLPFHASSDLTPSASIICKCCPYVMFILMWLMLTHALVK